MNVEWMALQDIYRIIFGPTSLEHEILCFLQHIRSVASKLLPHIKDKFNAFENLPLIFDGVQVPTRYPKRHA